MKYGEVLGRSFKALKSGTLWGYGFTALLVVAAPFALVAGIITATGAPALLGGMLGMGSAEADMLGSLVTLYATMIVGGLLALLPIIIARGGLIHAADAAIAMRRVSVGECWGFGLRNTGRTLAIETILGFFYLLAILLVEVPFILVVALGSSSGENNPAAMIGTMCCGYLFLFAAIMVLVVIYTGCRVALHPLWAHRRTHVRRRDLLGVEGVSRELEARRRLRDHHGGPRLRVAVAHQHADPAAGVRGLPDHPADGSFSGSGCSGQGV